MSDPGDPLEERLRAALAAEAEDVQPADDGLSRIRGRVAQRQKHSWWTKLRDQWVTRPAFAAAASVGVIVFGLGATVAVGQASDRGLIPPLPGTSPSASSTTPEATTSTTSKEPTSESATPGKSDPTKKPSTEKQTQAKVTTVEVPVYHITKDGSAYGVSQASASVRVKEGSRSSEQEQRAEGALQAIFDGGTELRSAGAGLWQDGTKLEDADLLDGMLRVDLVGPAGGGTDSSPEAARAALQQVVFTGLDAAPSAGSVQLRINGSPVSSFWNVLAISPDGVQRGDPALTRPFNTITAPEEGASTAAGGVEIGGEGAYDGGQVQWEVRQGGQVVQNGTQSTGTNGFASWSTTVELTPGSYKLRTFEQTDSGKQHQQTVSFTVTE